MPTTYTPLLKVAKPGAGELDGSWGDVVNNNITTMLEEAIAGRSVIDSWSGNSHTLTEANGTTSEARSAMLELAGAPTAAVTVICPNSSKIYVVSNGCGFDATIKTAAGTGVSVANGATKIVFCDGTNVKAAVSGVEGLTEQELGYLSGVESSIQAQIDGKEPTFAKNTAFNKEFGTTAGTVAQGNDSRIVNGQTAFSWGNHASADYAVVGHTHTISDVTGLQSALALKLEAGDVTAPNNPTITLTAGTGLTGGGSFTLNQAGNATITFNSSGAVGNHYQEFLSSGTWTKPAGATWVYVESVGGGGGGGNDTGESNWRSGGGGGAGVQQIMLASTLPATVDVVIGAGGAGGNSGSLTEGGHGGATTFGSFVTAPGGAGGGNFSLGLVSGQGGGGELPVSTSGGGGYSSGAGAGTVSGKAGQSVIGGAGGAGINGGSATSSAGGVSVFGGNGGDSTAAAATKAGDGVVPGGGGGASANDGGGGNGGNGRVRVWAW